MASRPSRKQNSSCDACRKLRIGCDVRIKDEGDPCSNCKRRGRECTLKHIANANPRGVKRSFTFVHDEKTGVQSEHSDTDYATVSKVPVASVEDDKRRMSDASSHGSKLLATKEEDSLALQQQAMRLHQMLWDVFVNRFETQVGIWIGSACCPFKSTYTAPTRLISRLVLTLTSYRRRLVDPQLAASIEPVQILSPSDKESLRQALLSAVHAYSARWLPFEDVAPGISLAAGSKLKEDLVKSLWTKAQKRIYSPMTQPTYCSILALHLFGNTPVPADVTEPNISEACLQVSLQHLKTISTQSRLLSSTNAKTVLVTNPSGNSTSTSEVSPLEYAQMEEIAFWFGIMCDTSRSLAKSLPPIIASVTSTDGQVWDQVRQQVDEFKAGCKNWRNSRVPISVDVLYGVVGHGTACRAMVWAAISRVQDALYHHLTDISVEEATTSALREFNRFNESFEYLLGLFLLNIDHTLGVLTLIDMLSATGYAHLLSNEYELRLSSAREMANSARIAVHVDQTSTGSPLQNSILLQSPYPENVVDALFRAGNSIIYLYKNQTLSISMVEAMFSLMLQGLRVLQIVSNTAYTAYNSLLDSCNEVGVKPKAIPDYSASSAITPECSQWSGTSSNIFEGEVSQELDRMVISNPTLMEQTIQRHERELGLN
ncbi:hypothetical protein EV356DRAFT_531726 [Viridothelium virens]|uniref:Zn(2)-C6 fungal-type domain-containing protein n=1 Tax=Viridothelium virens TaxID=1048519 RepID=A0A6A6HDJ8_VIRVR|nr:hypothetical protein EV356DRAFT_531726 [Viridothelium virens]